jgi:hypothetical protein
MQARPAPRRFAPSLVAALGLLAPGLLALGLLARTDVAAAAQIRAEPVRAAVHARSERKAFTDAEIIDGFMKTAFGAEYHLAGRVDRIRKYHAPVRIFIDGAARADRRGQLGRVVDDIAAKVRNLDIAIVPGRESANAVITLVRDRDLNKTIAAFYGSDRAQDIHQALDPQCLSGFRKNEKFEIQRSDVILTVDNGDFVFLDCAYEELLQSLGPINDTDAVPWTMFNDQVSMGFFDIYDQYIMNILYDPRIRAGMTVDQVRAVLPAVLPDVRAWVARVNNLPP